jgi:NAD(P)-dependent dehydrogenase (short-subunit alcohol dehydrogenase family)
VFGLINVTRAVLSLMRDQRSGHVINISGVAGAGAIRTVSGFGIYHASKYAVEGITEALAAEVKDLGIRATLVEPGSFRTDLHTNRWGDPAKLGAAIVAIVRAPDPRLRLPLGPDAVAQIERRLSAMRDDVAAWRDLSTSTNLDTH